MNRVLLQLDVTVRVVSTTETTKGLADCLSAQHACQSPSCVMRRQIQSF